MDDSNHFVAGHLGIVIGFVVGRSAPGLVGQIHAYLRGRHGGEHLGDGVLLLHQRHLQHTCALDAGEGGQAIAVGQLDVGKGDDAVVDARSLNARDQPGPADDGGGLTLVEQGGDGVVVAICLKCAELLIVFRRLNGLGIVQSGLAVLINDVAAKAIDEGIRCKRWCAG